MSLRLNRRDFLKTLLLLPLFDKGQHHNYVGEAGRSDPDQSVPNVLILVFDALAAQHLSVYGYARETTPNLAQFAERATVFHSHYAGGNFTTPGTTSLLTGTYPWSHRVFHLTGRIVEEYRHRTLFGALAAGTYNRIAYSCNPWADLLLYQLYDDIDVYIDQGEFSLIGAKFSSRMFPRDADIAFRSVEDFLLDRVNLPGALLFPIADRLVMLTYGRTVLREYKDLYPRGVPRLDSFNSFFLLEHAIDEISALIHGSHQPFVGYFHLYPPHEPYCPRREFVGLFEDGWEPVAKAARFFSKGHTSEVLNQWRREYDEYVAYCDAEFGRLCDLMEQTGTLDHTYVVFTSDHGQLFERGVHGHITPLLYDPIVRIPLLISKPGQQQREDVHTPTSCVDLLPTLVHAVGQPIPDWCEGEVLPTFADEEGSSEHSIFSVEAKTNPRLAPLTRGTVALIEGQYKLIHYFGYPGLESAYEMYDLANDPEELEDVYSSRESVAADLRDKLETKLREVNRPYVDARAE